MYMKWHKDDIKECQVRLGFYKSEFMDALTQCGLIAESIGVVVEEMQQLGMEKAMERFTGKESK